MNIGKLDYISNQAYHAIDAISASGLKMMSKSMRLYYLKSKLKRKESTALDMGTALHEAVLEPDLFRIDKYTLNASQIESLDCMINNSKVMFDYLLAPCEKEVSFFHKDNGFNRKIRCDAYDQKNGIVYDLKSTQHATPKKFEEDAYKLGYHIQGAFYLDTLKLLGYKANHFAFLVVPSISPFEPYAMQMSMDLIEQGRHDYQTLIEDYHDFLKTPHKPISFLKIDIPYYIKNKENI